MSPDGPTSPPSGRGGRTAEEGETPRTARAAARGAAGRLPALVVLLTVLGCWVVLGGGNALTGIGERVAELGVWGPPLFALCYALAVTALVPGAVLTASAGALFGWPLGVGVVLAGATGGAALSFALARRLGRPAVARYADSGRLARLDAQLTRHGFLAVLVVRLVPLFPFSLVNYGAGVAGVRFVPYVTATAVGIVPGTLVYTGLGTGLRDPGSGVLWPALAGVLVLSTGGWWATRRFRARTSAGATAAEE